MWDTLTVATEVTRRLHLEDQGQSRDGDGPAWLDAPAATRRGTVWQAVGFLHAALDIPAPDALLLLRARAYTQDTTLDHLVQQVLTGQVPAQELALHPHRSR